jgi:16S rRNA (cytidine1402-2'-O)-methyltransferase
MPKNIESITNKILEIKLLSGLYLVATPIGNLSDITIRAIEVLKSCDVIFCENPLHSQKLLKHYQISKKLQKYNDHSGEYDRNKILNELNHNKSVALISDAGTPCISDPGHKLVKYLKQYNHNIFVIAGASSVTTALLSSNMPSNIFTFCGFLPKISSQIEKTLVNFKTYHSTLIFFITAKQLHKIAALVRKIYPNQEIAICKELTKLHEKSISINSNDLNDDLIENINAKGEFVILINNQLKSDKSLAPFAQTLKMILAENISIKTAVKLTQEITQAKKSDIYKMALELKT